MGRQGNVLCLTHHGTIVRYERNATAPSGECPAHATYHTINCTDCSRSAGLFYQADGSLVLMSGTGTPLMATHGDIAAMDSRQLHFQWFENFLSNHHSWFANSRHDHTVLASVSNWLAKHVFACDATRIKDSDIGRTRLRLFNMGSMLINIEGMRRTYHDFIGATFTEKNINQGLYFYEHGPMHEI